MQIALIDTFIVPEESKAALLERSRAVQSFLKTLPGFVEGYVYEKKAGDNRHNVITTAVWENEEALENAKQTVAEEQQRQNFNIQEFRKQLKIEVERGIYERFPY